MLQHTETAVSRGPWKNFSTRSPASDQTVEIRRAHDDKTILRRRCELPPSFDWRHAKWRSL